MFRHQFHNLFINRMWRVKVGDYRLKRETYPLHTNRINAQTDYLVEDLTKRPDISISFKHLEVKRTSRDSGFATIHYPISIYLGEAIGDRESSALVPFIVEAKTDPEIATLILKGAAHIQGASEEMEAWITPNEDQAPKIWIKIYQETEAMLTMLSNFIHMPPSSPNFKE